MPSYIRLLGDSAKNNQEVRNTFKEPVLIPANAKIALTGVNAVLADDLTNERFVVSGSTGEFNIGLAGTLAAATIPNGDYSLSTFVNALETAANYSASTANFVALLGLHHKIDMDVQTGSQIQIETFYGPIGPASFNTVNEWYTAPTTDAPAATGADSFTATATLASETTLLSFDRVPLVSSRFQAKLVNADTINVQIAAVDPFDPVEQVCWGLRVQAVDRQYEYGVRVGNTVTWSPVGDTKAIANDTVQVSRYANIIKILITRSGGAQAANISYTGVGRSIVDTANHIIHWAVTAATGGQVSESLCTQVAGVTYPSAGLQNVAVNASLNFLTAGGAFNSILALYTGFTGEKNTLVYHGDPATIKSRLAVGGLPSYPGILITIDGMGLLKSYDGAATAKSPSNIIYSVNQLQNRSQYLQLDIPEPLYLSVGNAKEINVNELRVRLFEAAGFNPLTFVGNPSFSFMIEYP